VVVPSEVIVNVQFPVPGRSSSITLPVATVHVGWTTDEGKGGVGVTGCMFITTDADAADVHKDAFVTVKVYVPGERVIVVLVPVPVVVLPPGVLVTVHVPVAGKLLKTTLPVATVQVGWVMVPIVGAVGVTGWALITTDADAAEVHNDAFVTVKVYVPVANPEIVVLVPVPVVVVPPGVIVNVHVPVEGKPFKTTLPVANAHVGCVIIPTVGAVGGIGTVLITTDEDAVEVHPNELVTVKV